MKALDVAIRRKAFGAGGHTVHENLELFLESGEFVAITGPSGCGKTTLLNIVAGLDKAYEGSVSFGEAARAGLVYLFQTPRLLPWRSVLQNLMLVLDASPDARDKARALLRDVELEAFADHFPGQLSLGMQKRVSLARAFAMEPSLLLMDEPFSSLDADAAARLRKLLVRLLEKRTVTTLLVTHDHDEAVELADRILIFSTPPARVARQIDVPLDKAARQDKDAVAAFRRGAFGQRN